MERLMVLATLGQSIPTLRKKMKNKSRITKFSHVGKSSLSKSLHKYALTVFFLDRLDKNARISRFCLKQDKIDLRKNFLHAIIY
jgi:hypothetical protein